eukprot:TRINITY_DN18828_c0_g2_i1.p1 TRINITY_DN18828_c0_g2~~TRINITY_DN18828_c0_g2_i1.p1  ORF type:complete len:390 (-),score=73.06 TRINITY_DN18828_c0_g2_i1:294-1463(-)
MGAAGLARPTCACRDCGQDCQTVEMIAEMPNGSSYLVNGGIGHPTSMARTPIALRPELDDHAWQEEEVFGGASSWTPPMQRQVLVGALPAQSLIGNHKVPLLPEILTPYDSVPVKRSAPLPSMAKVLPAATAAQAATAADAAGGSALDKGLITRCLKFDLGSGQPIGLELCVVDDDAVQFSHRGHDTSNGGDALVVVAISEESPLAAKPADERGLHGLIEGDAILEVNSGGTADASELLLRLQEVERSGGQLTLLVLSRPSTFEVQLEGGTSSNSHPSWKLGLSVEKVPGEVDGASERVRVAAIMYDGLVNSWNATSGLRRVCVGDIIMRVDGVAASARSICEALRRFETRGVAEGGDGVLLPPQTHRRRLSLSISALGGGARRRHSPS